MSTLAYFLSALLAVFLVAALVLLMLTAQVLISNRLCRHVDRALSPEVCDRCHEAGFHNALCFYALRDSA